MRHLFNKDFRDFLDCLNLHHVDYIVVGGYAVILHGYQSTTGYLDIWVHRTAKNYNKLVKAFDDFGLSVFDMTENQFLYNARIDVFSFGISPVANDIMVRVKGLTFTQAFRLSQWSKVDETYVRYLHLNHLIEAKRASGRHKDLNDIEHLMK